MKILIFGKETLRHTHLSPLKIEKIKDKVDKVLISIKNISRNKRNEIIRKFQRLNIEVIVIPSLNDLRRAKQK